MSSTLSILIPLALGLTALMIVLGLVNLFRTGTTSRSRSNKLMQMRVLFQFVAIILIMLAVWIGGRGPGWLG